MSRLLPVALLWFAGCTDEQIAPGPVAGDNAYVTLTLNTGNGKEVMSRSLSATEEKTIQDISVLVFRKNAAGIDDELYYQANVVGELTVDEQTGHTQALVKLLKSVGGEKYSIVVIANCGKDVGYANIGKDKAYLQSRLSFGCADNWKAGTGKGNYTPLPMWGEIDYQPIDGNTAATPQAILMLRAVARFDVGLNFASGGDLASETFDGLTGYTLKSVHVYRTRNQGLTIPATGNYSATATTLEATKPTVAGAIIHAGAVGATSDRGLEYAVTDDGTHAFVRGIYVPENSVGATEATTAVVVGIADADGHTGYYRMAVIDSRHTSDGVVPILRNHRYIFNVKSVNGRGQETPDEALNAVSTELDYNVLVWDEGDQNLYLSGRYYFIVDKRTLELPAYGIDPASRSEAVAVKYTTNLPKEKLRWQWAWDVNRATTATDTIQWVRAEEDTTEKDPDGYAVTNGTITLVGAPGNNTGKAFLDSLCFTAGDVKGHVTVTQEAIDMSYRIQCADDATTGIDGIKMYGSYMIDGVPDPLDNYIELTLTHIPAQAIGMKWHVRTEATAADGTASDLLAFEGEGLITAAGTLPVTLYPTTTAKMTPGGLYTLHFDCNSTYAGYVDKGAYRQADCTVQVPIGFKSKVIGVAGSEPSLRPNSYINVTPSYNFFFGTPTGAAGNPNFSMAPGARMPVVGGLTFVQNNDIPTLLKSNPDILIVTYDTKVNVASTKDYLDKGGVVIYCTQENTNHGTAGLRELFNLPGPDGTTVSHAYISDEVMGVLGNDGVGGQYVPIVKPAPIKSTDADGNEIELQDPIYTGVPDIEDHPNSTKAPYFAALDGSHINGNDPSVSDPNGVCYLGSSTEPFHHVMRPAPGYENDVIMYTKSSKMVNPSLYGEGAVFIRWRSRNLVIFADGGCMGGTTTSTSTTQYPFRINANYTYLRNPNAGYPVDNSLIFANVMAWAIYQAEYHGINSGGLSGTTRSAKK
ncbi:MAG: hypothetical protein LBL97_00330 [Prevotellaceae bacterium]|nr:hypothetical protein [Prevotellaceae bacterium]